MKGEIKAICISEKRGTEKTQVPSAEFIKDHGIKNDAHAGNWHRQISLLSFEKIEQFRRKGADVAFGAFGENLVVEGFDFREMPVGTRFKCNDVMLEITQIGKECHSRCRIYDAVGDCIMPREGVFAVVLHGGIIKKGDILECIKSE
ncbi:MAG: MOSC domain-containing protein [Firmicutes bacterium]|nr:MOSC domain-containing protein [Bacillota bacterium]